MDIIGILSQSNVNRINNNNRANENKKFKINGRQ